MTLTPGRRTVTVHHVRAVLDGARRAGIDTATLLHEANIPPLLAEDARARVTAGQFSRLFRALYLATQDEFLGLGATPSRPGTFAMMCKAALGCPDLGSALDRAGRFYGLFPGGPRLAVQRPPGPHAVFRLFDAFPGDRHRFLTESVLIIFHRLGSWLIGRDIPLLRAEFAYPPPVHHEEYAELFDCPARFEAEVTGVWFDARALSAPLVRDEAAVDAMLRRAPFDLLARPAHGRVPVGEQVRGALSGALRTGRPLPGAGEVAERLAVSPATLRRRLEREHTSYRRLRDELLRDEALAALAGGVEPIGELAVRLGFSEDTAFHRAFRRWTGTTPARHRALGAPAEPAPDTAGDGPGEAGGPRCFT
ncbi:AraC family transcriptional regulator [Streptomyces sp. BI20]|uniref:AraC family transcriptional regulator n=1 Tax=Streptomyces sp. BI20 TaxID=3403460 RepID=UPI003C76A578